MTVWFTSDHHFGHANIIPLCRRPFSDAAEMDETMIERWNAVVGTQDEVWHLGDFAHRCGPNRVAEIFGRLRGRAIHLVRGNHDRRYTLALPWTSIQHYAELVVDHRMLVLFHYSLRVWNRSHFGSLSLYGHSHGTLPGTAASCDVGVDVWDFRPASLDEIVRRIGWRVEAVEKGRVIRSRS
ncbi:metallophosphoesterase [Methylobacterium radiotolerans]|nr:metallophosphoesterase [Methylobacterium radiotolerans]